jgi:putative transposase
MDKNSLSTYDVGCKYHIVFAPKYRRQAIYGELKKDIGRILRELYERKNIEIIEAELCADHNTCLGGYSQVQRIRDNKITVEKQCEKDTGVYPKAMIRGATADQISMKEYINLRVRR